MNRPKIWRRSWCIFYDSSIDEELSSTSGVFPDIFVLNSNSDKLSELYSLHSFIILSIVLPLLYHGFTEDEVATCKLLRFMNV